MIYLVMCDVTKCAHLFAYVIYILCELNNYLLA